jgi:hypothetical protein
MRNSSSFAPENSVVSRLIAIDSVTIVAFQHAQSGYGRGMLAPSASHAGRLLLSALPKTGFRKAAHPEVVGLSVEEPIVCDLASVHPLFGRHLP